MTAAPKSLALRGGVIAAGHGTRLKADGYRVSKPMIPVGGRPLIGHALDRFRAVGVRQATVLINEGSDDCRRWLSDHGDGLDLDLIVRTTPSSYASFELVAARLTGARAVITTVDAIMALDAFQHFVGSAARFPNDAVVLGLTDHVDDENPLWATLNEDGRVLRLGGDQGSHVTAGLYWLPAHPVAPPTAGFRPSARLSQMAGRPKATAGLWRRFAAGVRHRSGARHRGRRTGRVLPPGPRTPAHEQGPDDLRGRLREPAHSPGRVEDDAAIMRSVGEALTERGFSVELVAADGRDGSAFGQPVRHVRAWDGSRSPGGDGEEGLDRRQRAGLDSQHLPPPHGRTVRAPSRRGADELDRRRRREQVRPADCAWIKRYDFHATQRDDVMYAASETGWREALRRFAERGIPFVVAQEHVAGDLVKFYGVRNGEGARDANWFQWFYHRDKGMLGHSFDPARLSEAALHAAAALELEIFGGDAVIRANGEPMIIDLNAWPSYALYRDRAAQAIADCLTERFRRRPRLVASARN